MSEESSHDDWVKRDAAVVWHGFTQMSTYADNAPIIVDRAEGRELIDIDGNRYLDAISSLWVTTLGHRVPELDAALRDQIDRVRTQHAAGQRQHRRDPAGRGTRTKAARRPPALAVRVRRRRRGRTGPEDRVPVLDQPGRDGQDLRISRSAAPTTATPSVRCR